MRIECAIFSSVACVILQFFFFRIFSQTARFSKKKSYWTQNVLFDYINKFCLKHFLFQEELSERWLRMCIDLRVKFSEHPSGGGLAVSCGQTDAWTYRQTDVTKLIVNFRNFANPPKSQKRSTFEEQYDPYCDVCLIRTHLCNKMYMDRVQRFLYNKTK